MATADTTSPRISDLTSGFTSDRSKLRFLDRTGSILPLPREWEPAWVEVDAPREGWELLELTLQGRPLPLALRHLGGRVCVLAEWPRSGPGNYRLELRGPNEGEERSLAVLPRKISQASFVSLLDDLENRLPVNVALGLQRTGAKTGLDFRQLKPTTRADELLRLRRAILGTSERPGLADLLPEVARDPHRVLQTDEHWVLTERARRPHPARLAQAMSQGHNLDPEGTPLRVFDARAEHTTDVYENRLLQLFLHQVNLRLRRFLRGLSAASDGYTGEALELKAALAGACRHTSFLDGVRLPVSPPGHLTMVLLNRPPYRGVLEGYLEFQRSVTLRLEEFALDAPLENLPRLYELWGTLEVLDALLEVGAECGYTTASQRILDRDREGVYVRVLPDGQPALVLTHPQRGQEVRLIPQRRYGSSGKFTSITFDQIPDLVLEVQSEGNPTRFYLFDPKYKLDSERYAVREEAGAENDGMKAEGARPFGRPQKIDMDRMHAYRDAIRDAEGRRVVEYAAILYPGPSERNTGGIEALSAVPGEHGTLPAELRTLLTDIFHYGSKQSIG